MFLPQSTLCFRLYVYCCKSTDESAPLSSVSSERLRELKPVEGLREQGQTIHANQWIQMRKESLARFSLLLFTHFLIRFPDSGSVCHLTMSASSLLSVWWVSHCWLNILMICKEILSYCLHRFITTVALKCRFGASYLKACPIMFLSPQKSHILEKHTSSQSVICSHLDCCNSLFSCLSCTGFSLFTVAQGLELIYP